MDNKQTILWLAGIVARGLAWVLAAKFGMEAVEAGTVAESIGAALGALTLAGISIYTSVKGRKTLLAKEPPIGQEPPIFR